MSAILLTMLLLQQAYTRADFVQVQGANLQARFDAAIQQGKRASDETFWVAYRIGVGEGVRVDSRYGGINIMRPVDGIELVPENPTPQRVDLFFLVRKSDGGVERVRLLDANGNYRFHDRRVYWAGDGNGGESLNLLTRLLENRDTSSASMLMTAISIHNAAESTPVLMKLVEQHPDAAVRRQAISLLGQNHDPKGLTFLEQQLKQK
jgi:HEAT repeat protein